jgi:hypothetical protein
MKDLLNQSFFKFTLGFLVIVSISLGIIALMNERLMAEQETIESSYVEIAEVPAVF